MPTQFVLGERRFFSSFGMFTSAFASPIPKAASSEPAQGVLRPLVGRLHSRPACSLQSAEGTQQVSYLTELSLAT